MKSLSALFLFLTLSSAFAQSGPPAPGTSGSTISGRNSNNPDPTRPRRPEWNPTPTPSPTPAPTPSQPRPEPRRPERQPDRREPRPMPERNPNMIYVGDYVLYNGVEYEVLGGSNGTLEVRTPFERQRYYIPAAAVARTTGCAQSANGPVCVGDMTIGLNNIYYGIIGIEWNGRVVVQTTDVTRTVYGQIDPNSLRVVR